jgi:hypothetical protein
VIGDIEDDDVGFRQLRAGLPRLLWRESRETGVVAQREQSSLQEEVGAVADERHLNRPQGGDDGVGHVVVLWPERIVLAP